MWSACAHQTIYLDANIIIYAIEQGYRWADTTRSMLTAIDNRLFRAVTSELAIAEVLSRPFAVGNHDEIAKFEHFFSPRSALEMSAIDRHTLRTAARLQGQLRLKLFDAIHVATARLSGCEYFLTEDERLGRALAGDPKWLKLSDVS
jgi:predicted nucleic acid-binding protein